MRKVLLISGLLLLKQIAVSAQTPDSLLTILDDKIKNKHVYEELKEQKINELKVEKRELKNNALETYSINRDLYNAYKNYMSDSAIYYLNQNISIADSLNDISRINETRIASATLFVRLGMYFEARELLEKVKEETLSLQQHLDFFLAYRELYLGLGSYSQNARERHNYWEQARHFDDLMMNITPDTSEEHLRSIEKSLRVKNDFTEALKINDQRLKLTRPLTVPYALVTFHRSLIYRKMGDVSNEKKYLALSAISDVQLAIKDNASISILAALLMREGDINRAYQYIRFCLDNIKDYNTRIRSSEILNIQAIIDKEYQSQNDKKNKELQAVLIIVCILSVLLTISVVYVYKQMKKGQAFSRKLKEINGEQELLNAKLSDMNEELKKRNLEVAEADHIKQEYIAYFLDECAKYIIKLDNYRLMVNKKLQGRQYEGLYNITRDNSLKAEESKELFLNFDTMFINLFPDFLTRFNALLNDEEQIIVKKGEVLNTELRIYALIRLGISDSSKIARFLGYSVNTIYNYRTKMKNKSKVAREDFEESVKKIGAFI
ncbi:DUF6377 domain-containing protein [Niabella yanshanensis]|uniref:DUF6377 domain-containing protein n=1 Tax=Niabella yanshanensis TaxID=577386 RepID=A0ABZ0W6F3_9BACT|nr:DUF6377 domain-containing protein [Niabella yanshanensis]WQD38858.1 DUF6377 domain-containing protein [Niabella yanshanensis]